MLRDQTGRTVGQAAELLAAVALLWLGAVASRPAGAQEAAAQDDAATTGPPAVTLAPGQISGTVTGSGGTNLPTGLAVRLLDPVTGAETTGTMTNGSGRYVLKNVPAGLYELRVGEPGLAALIEVSEGADADALDVLMPALLVVPPPPGGPPGLAPTAAPAMAVAGDDGITLVAAPILPEPERSAAVTASGGGPPGGGPPGGGPPGGGPPGPEHPGKPRPPRPPGRPPDKPLPPPFVSPTCP